MSDSDERECSEVGETNFLCEKFGPAMLGEGSPIEAIETPSFPSRLRVKALCDL
jgi:hypothetical protein